jgi:hypothetical protein
MLELNVEPYVPGISWSEFTRNYPKFSIALDGYVKEGPVFSECGPYVNFNHHDGVSRLETRCTAAQVLVAIRQGLFCLFKHDNEPNAHIYVNDCDEDSTLAVWLLLNHEKSRRIFNPIINRLVSMEDMLDTTAGAYPYPTDTPTLQEMAWIFEPYRKFRMSEKYFLKTSEDYTSVIYEVCDRITRYTNGESHKIPLDTRYTILEQFPNWSMVKEIGLNARSGLFQDGILAFVSVRERPDGKYSYILARMSQYINFPVDKFCKRFNQIEKCTFDTWGGGNIVIGSPRVGGSSLKPHELSEIIEMEMSTQF